MRKLTFLMLLCLPFLLISQELEVEGSIKIGDDSSANPAAGTVRWNPNTNDFEGFDGDSWRSLTKGNSWHDNSINETKKVIASDADDDHEFGYSVSIHGNYAIIGSRKADTFGAAYVFFRSGGSWVEQTKLVASDAAANDLFGGHVDISGQYAVVGAYGDDDNGQYTGSAYVFVRSGTNWTEQDKITASDGSSGDYFGISVAISGDYVIVGANSEDDNGPQAGAAYVYKRSGTSWNEQAKILASDGTDGDRFGWDVEISGNTAVISALYNGFGSVYVFKRTGTNWNEIQILEGSDAGNNDLFGFSIGISGNHIVVGSYQEDSGNDFNNGAAYIFYYDGSSWAEEQKLLPSNSSDGLNFGYRVDIDGDYIIIGCPNDDPENTGLLGTAYIFKKVGTIWFEQAQLIPTDNVNGDNFGSAVGIYGNKAVVGAFRNDNLGDDWGMAYFFE